MNQKKTKSAIAKIVKAVIGTRKVEVGYFTRTDEVDQSSFNLDELGDPNHTDLFEPVPLWDKHTIIPENGLVDLYLYTFGFYGELDTNLLVRIRDGRVVHIYENSEDPRNEFSLVENTTPAEGRKIVGIPDDLLSVERTFLVKTKHSDCQPITILGHVWETIRRPNPWATSTWKSTNEMRVLGSRIKDGDSIQILRVGWGEVIGEVQS